MEREDSKWWLRLRVIFGCVLGLLALNISAPGQMTHASGVVAGSLIYQDQGPDLCALLKQIAGDEPVHESGDGAPDSSGCGAVSLWGVPERTKSKFSSMDVYKADTPDAARAIIQQSGEGCTPAGWGDISFECSHTGGLIFARGCYYASIAVNDYNPAGSREIAGSLAGALPSTCPGQVLPATAGPTAPAPTDTATPLPNLDLTVDHIEVVQVVQDENNNAQIYAGKDTLVRAFVGVQGAITPVPNVEVELRAFPVGNDVGVVISARNSPFTAPLSPSRSALTDTVNFDLPADLTTSSTYPIKVTINPNKTISETTYDNNDLNKQLKFVEPDKLRIGYVRIGYTPPGSANVVWPTGPLQTYTSTLVNIYPTNENELQYYEFPNRLVYPGPLTGIDNKERLRNWLRQRYDRLRSRVGEAAPDVVVGYLAWQGFGPTNVFTDAVGLADVGTYAGELNNLVGGPPPTPTAIVAAPNFLGRVAWVIDYNGGGGPDSSPRVLAHEVGHILTLHHPGTNDTGPGSPCWARTINTFPGYWTFGTGQTWEIGYNHLTRDLVPDTDYDIMNYCAANLNWISMLDYKRLFNGIHRYNPDDPDYLKPDPELDDIVVSGSIRADGSSGSLDPVYRNTSSGPRSSDTPGYAANTSELSSMGAGLQSSPIQQQQGQNCVRFIGSGGTISDHCFDVSFFDDETGQQLTQAGFSFRIPYPQGATGAILLRNGKELDRRTPGSNPPKLTITSPKAGDTWDGSQTITWTASDPDGDKLTYEVHYSPDGGYSWFPLELGVQDTQYKINTADVAGGDKVLLRVFASDGFNTAKADVGPIKIPNSPPWNPPVGSVSQPPQKPPGNPGPGSGSGSGPDALLLILLGAGLALVVGSALVGTILITRRRPRAWEGQAPTAYPPSYPLSSPPYAQPPTNVPPPPAPYAPPATAPQGPRVPPPPPPMPRTPGAPAAPGPKPNVQSPKIPGNPFASAENEYARLRGELSAGRMIPQQFEAAISQIRVADAQGRTWMLAPQTGQWLVYDGRAWVPGRPY